MLVSARVLVILCVSKPPAFMLSHFKVLHEVFGLGQFFRRFCLFWLLRFRVKFCSFLDRRCLCCSSKIPSLGVTQFETISMLGFSFPPQKGVGAHVARKVYFRVRKLWEGTDALQQVHLG